MIILHLGFLHGQLLLWGETASEAKPGRKSKKGKSRKEQTFPSPYDAGKKPLLAALQETLPTVAQGVSEEQKHLAWLPSVTDAPVASHPLIAAPPAAGSEVTLRPWTISALPLAKNAAVDFLCACMGRDMLSSGILVGKTIAYWSAALRLAGEIIAHEQFLPGVEEKETNIVACWKPILTGAEPQRLARLAQAMPAACRALSTSSEAPPQAPPQQVLGDFVQTIVDALVRSTIAPIAAPKRTRKKQQTFDSIHDAWLAALRSDDAVVEEKKSEQKKLVEQFNDWRRPISVSLAAPFRLCFRLEEPEEKNGRKPEPKMEISKGGKWHLRFLLQGVDDPSLLVPVADAWKSTGRKAAVLKKAGFEPQEYLLTALGQAAEVYPAIETSLKKSAMPAECPMDVHDAYSFLMDKAWALEQAGFGIMLPAWWTRKGTKQRLSVQARVHTKSTQGAGGLSLASLVDFDWQVALGDKTLTLEELETLAKMKAPLVKVRGQWVQMSAEEIQAALDFWKKKGKGEASLRDVVQMALGATTDTGGLAFGGVEASGWIEDFLKQLEGKAEFAMQEEPEGFHGTLRPYQERGYSWLAFLQRWGLGACLADDMGLGKTIQTLALLEQNWEAGNRRPTLLVCPMSVVGNWHKEAEKFTPDLPVLVHHGMQRTKGKEFKTEAEKYALILTSYALLHRDFDLFKEVAWQGIILDEAQNIKNPHTKQSQSARSLPGDFRVALTGTPVENHVGDLWSIMEFLNPGFLGKQAEFRRNFLIPIQAYNDTDASQRLKRLTGPFILRRLKTDKSIISDLPDKMEMKVYCNLTKEQASLYQAVVEEGTKDLDKADEGIQRKGMILGMLTKLKQVCNHPAQFLGDNSAIPNRSGKLARLTEMLEELLEVGDRALIFSQFTEMGDIIKKHIQETFGKEVLFLHGGVPKKQRDHMVARFQGSEDDAVERPQVFLLSLKAGGTGLNLTAANHVFHFDRWWNPAVENQATDRAFRIGQTRNVQVHKFLCAGTLEDRIDEMIERKQQIAGMVVGTGENWLTELSNEQLKDLFALRKEALGE